MRRKPTNKQKRNSMIEAAKRRADNTRTLSVKHYDYALEREHFWSGLCSQPHSKGNTETQQNGNPVRTTRQHRHYSSWTARKAWNFTCCNGGDGNCEWLVLGTGEA